MLCGCINREAPARSSAAHSPCCQNSPLSTRLGFSFVCMPAQLSAVDGVDIYGPSPSVGRAALCSFNVKGLHASDVSTVLDQAGA